VSEPRWVNQSQPQTLQIAVFLLYANAFFGVLFILRVGLIPLLRYQPWGPIYVAAVVGSVLAGRGIASGRKWGYGLGVGVSLFPFGLRLLAGGVLGAASLDIVGLMFAVALVALLVHPQSRDYQRIWFK
jgi:hypothetical protein